MWIQSKIIVITLSVVSIDCSVFILLYRFGLAVQSGVSGPQGADSAPSVLWMEVKGDVLCLGSLLVTLGSTYIYACRYQTIFLGQIFGHYFHLHTSCQNFILEEYKIYPKNGFHLRWNHHFFEMWLSLQWACNHGVCPQVIAGCPLTR